MAHRDVLGRVVGTVDSVLHVRGASQHLEPDEAPGRDPQRDEVVVVEHQRDVGPEGRRPDARIHHDAEHCTGGDPHELGLAVAQPAVEAAQHTGGRARLGVLGVLTEHHPVTRTNGRVEGPGEHPPVVAMRAGFERHHPADTGCAYLHAPIMPKRETRHG